MGQTSSKRAAIYVRMSTDHQDYSTDHQRTAIRSYALAKGFDIVREYVDEAKSGLDIKRRAGLLQLIRDVESLQADFDTVIVYDVSRWGRFQDIDEAAYHEHTCRRAGIRVIYCAEHFADETGPYAALMKSMKRVMAAEYSRELSEKVFLAQSRFVELGFKQGGHAGYGLRRLAIKSCGTPRGYLGYLESKASLTDRVILVWGPDSEVETVRRIYALYVDDKLSVGSIMRLLNDEGIASEFGGPWTQHMLRSVLSNVKYCGTLAYNRRSGKLSGTRHKNERDKWIVNTSALDPIIAPLLFDAAQAERRRRTHRHSHPELIQMLQTCHQKHGRISSGIIANDPSLPDPQLFVRAFGSLVDAYDAAGLPRRFSYAFTGTKSAALGKRKELLRKVEQLALRAGATVVEGPAPFTLRLNDKLLLRIDVAICRTPRRGQPNWKLADAVTADFVITARLARGTFDIIDYLLTDRTFHPGSPAYVRQANLDQFSEHRYSDVESLFGDTNPAAYVHDPMATQARA